MPNLIDRTIAYSHRQWTDYTQDIFIDGVWLASAKNWSQADTVELAGAELDAPIECSQPDNLCNVHEPCPEHAAAAAQYLADDDPPDIPDEYPNPTPGGPPPPEFAQTLQSQAIEARIKRCANCDGAHFTWACPEIALRLFAPALWSDPALGRELCRMKWRDFKGFVTLLREVRDHGHLVVYAASYQAFIRSHRPDSDLTITQVLTAWAREMSGEPMPQIKVAA